MSGETKVNRHTREDVKLIQCVKVCCKFCVHHCTYVKVHIINSECPLINLVHVSNRTVHN